jgi:hypothetical protein
MATTSRPDAAGCAARERVFGDAALLHQLLLLLARTQPSALACLEATCRYFRAAAAPHWRAACVSRWRATRLTGPRDRDDAPAWRALFRQMHAATAAPGAARPRSTRFDCGSYKFSADVSFRGAHVASAALGTFPEGVNPEGARYRTTLQSLNTRFESEEGEAGGARGAARAARADSCSSSSADADATPPPLRACDVFGTPGEFVASLFATREDGAVACLLRDTPGVWVSRPAAHGADNPTAVQAQLKFAAWLRALPGGAGARSQLRFAVHLMLRAADAPVRRNSVVQAPPPPLFWNVPGDASPGARARPLVVQHLYASVSDGHVDLTCDDVLRTLQALTWHTPPSGAGAGARAPPRLSGRTRGAAGLGGAVQPASCCDVCWHGYRPAPLDDDGEELLA